MKEISLGLIFLIVLITLSVSTVIIGKIPLGKEGPVILIKFDEARGLRGGDPAYADGVEIGYVKDVKLDSDGVVVRIAIEQVFTLFDDYAISIEESSLVGGKYVSIRRGSSSKKPIALSETMPLKGEKPSSFLQEAAELISENRDNVKETIKNLKDFSTDAKDIVTANKDPIADTIKNIKDITETVISGKGSLGKLINDDALFEQARIVLDDINNFVNELRNGKGTVAKLVNDEKMSEEISETISNLKASSGLLREFLQEAKDKNVIDNLASTLEGANQTIGRAGQSRLILQVGGFKYDESELAQTKLAIQYWPSEDKFFHFGGSLMSYDKDSEILFEDKVAKGDDQNFAKLDIQIGYAIPWFLDKSLTFRAGLLEGKAGAGLDVHLNKLLEFRHPFQVSYEIRQSYDDLDDEDIDELIDGSMMRIFVKTPLSRQKELWWQQITSSIYFFAGINRLSNDSEVMFGISLEYEEEDIKTLVGLLGLSR